MQIPPNINSKECPQVRIRRLNSEAEPTDYATVSLRDGQAVTDNEELMEKWQKAGILGRPEAGRVFPQDGTRFLDELPYMYRSSYYWAEKVPPT